MNVRLTLFVITALVAVIGIVNPVDMAVAQTEAIPDAEGEEENHEGKTCAFKERKTTSIDAGLNI